jgi:hypothetical protein
MFRKLFLKTKASERAEIFGLIDFVLAAAGLMMELAALELLAFGPGQRLLGMADRPPGPAGQALALLPWCAAMVAASAPARLMRDALRGGFGLDPRPASARLGALAGRLVFFLAYLWMASWAVYEAMLSGSLILWSAALLAAVWFHVLGVAWWRRRRLASSLRDMAPEETPGGLKPFLDVWRRSNAATGRIMVSDLFQSGLAMPGYLGSDVVVSGKALAAFTPDALKSGVLMAMMSQMLKLDRNRLVMRLAAMTLAVPGAIIVTHSLGFLLGFPLSVGPRLLPLIWVAVWFAALAARLLDRQMSKFLCHKLNAAVVTVTGNLQPLVTAIGTMARYNQVPWRASWYARLLTDWPAPVDQFERLKEALAKGTRRRPEDGPPAGSGPAPGGPAEAGPPPLSGEGGPPH